jgi:hypothetical protein
VIDTGDKPFGKGKNVIAILRFAADQDAKAVCLFDADLTSTRGDWVGSLAAPVLSTDFPTLVTPIYAKNRFQGNTTNHLVYPYLYAVFGARVEQPIAGEFAMNGTFVREVLDQTVYESTLRYGIDVFLTATALLHGYRVSHATLTKKLHNQWFPKLLYISQQVLDSLLRILVTSGPPKPSGVEADVSPDAGRSSVDDRAVPPDNALVASTFARVADYLRVRGEALRDGFPSLPLEFLNAAAIRPETAPLAPTELPAVHSDLWCALLTDCLANLEPPNFYAIRDDLVALFLCRVSTYWQQIAGRTPAEIDAMIYDQAVTLQRILAEHRVSLPRLAKEDIPAELRPGPWAESVVGEEQVAGERR